MRLKETLSTTTRISLLSGNVVGIFPTMILETDPFYDRIYDICFGYYTERSASKTISPTFEEFIRVIKENSTEFTDTADMLIGKLIRGKFIDKWTRVYNALICSCYNPLQNYDETETKTARNQDKTTYNITDTKTLGGSDTTTYATRVTDDGKVGTKETTVIEGSNDNDRFGFNSTTAVSVESNYSDTRETVTGLANDNTTHNLQTKDGTETKARDYTNTDNKTGTDTKDFLISETDTKSGRNVSAQSLIQEELTLADERIFFDIIYKDIDSIATIPLYI